MELGIHENSNVTGACFFFYKRPKNKVMKILSFDLGKPSKKSVVFHCKSICRKKFVLEV